MGYLGLMNPISTWVFCLPSSSLNNNGESGVVGAKTGKEEGESVRRNEGCMVVVGEIKNKFDSNHLIWFQIRYVNKK